MRASVVATLLLIALTACHSQPEQQHPTPATPPPAVQVGVTGGTATVLSKIDPVLPQAARRANVHGPVILEVQIDVTGRPEVVSVLRGDPLLNQLAIDAARQWRFEPVTFRGALTPVILSIVVSFKDR